MSIESVSGSAPTTSRVIPLKSFKLTISPKGDVSKDTIDRVVAYAMKSDMYHVVLEHGTSGKAHIHALLNYSTPKLAPKIQENVWQRMVKPFSPGSIGKFAVQVNANYDSRWASEYLSKESTHEVLATNYDASLESNYYPSPEVQTTLQTISRVHVAVDSFYAEHALLFAEYVIRRPHPGVTDAIEYFYNRMFVKKDMRVNADKRRVHQMAHALLRYHLSDQRLDFEDRKFVASLDGPAFDFRG